MAPSLMSDGAMVTEVEKVEGSTVMWEEIKDFVGRAWFTFLLIVVLMAALGLAQAYLPLPWLEDSEPSSSVGTPISTEQVGTR